jgi:glycosyltransferase involved in cell wall biosynthesis
MRIFIGIGETSGFYTRLYQGFCEKNINCFYALLNSNKHNYQGVISDNFITKRCRHYYDSASKQSNSFVRLFLKLIANFYKLLVFIWSFVSYDTFIFTQCRCFWGVSELALYHLFRKKTIIVNLGSMTRYPFADGNDMKGIISGKQLSTEDIIKKLKEKTKLIGQIEKYVDYFVNLPAQAQMGSREFINFGQIGLPMDFSISDNDKYKSKDDIKIRILHAPSYIGVKGSEEFRAIINSIKDRYDIEYTEITGKTNSEVLEEIKKTDFILDELYSDTPMATFAMEAASMAKPAVIGSYFAGLHSKYYDSNMLPPSMFVQPPDIKSAIITMLENRTLREELGNQAQKFVFENYNTSTVAQKFIAIINGECPKSWFINPNDMNYIWGWGLKDEEVLNNVQQLINKYGTTCLKECGVKATHIDLYIRKLEEKNGTNN